jgi:hypothetical protein
MAAANQHDMTLCFTHAERMVELPAEQVETSTSPHTSRELRQPRTKITCAPEDAATMRNLLEDSPLAHEQRVEWDGRLATQSYIQGGSRDSAQTSKHPTEEAELAQTTE